MKLTILAAALLLPLPALAQGNGTPGAGFYRGMGYVGHWCCYAR